MEHMELTNVCLSADGKRVRILDQTLLPNRVEYLELDAPEALFDAVKKLRVRGAPCIGIFAGYAIYVLMLGFAEKAGMITSSSNNGRNASAKGLHPDESTENSPSPDDGKNTTVNGCNQDKSGENFRLFQEQFGKYKAYLFSSRPTAVNLGWALDRMESVLDDTRSAAENLELLRREALAIHKEDIEMCRRISEYGLSLLKDGDGVLTHCNAGPLATSRYGTALGPLLLGKERGMNLHVFADETRPLLQGARLTSFELANAGIDVTLICDNMASIVMKSGRIQACFVGADRISANGDFANKIGTSGVAILAKHYGIPFYTLAPTSTVDFSCPDGAHIPIEERDPEEIRTMHYREPKAPAEVKCYNPAFDVTDHTLLTAIITDRGIAYPPFTESLAKLCK